MSIKFTARPEGFKDYYWSEEETEFLKRHWSYLPVPEILKTIKRSAQSVNVKAGKLGLVKNREAAWRDNWKFISENPYKSISVCDRAYLAGIIDGEGTIDSQTNAHQEHWRISVGNTDKELIDWLCKTVPYSRLHKNKLRFHWKQSWRWALLSNIKVFRLLEVLYPYFIVKRKKATAALRYLRPKMRRFGELKGTTEAGHEPTRRPARRPVHWPECPLFRDSDV